jgi:predicted phage terminase large subunit-like protein
VVNEEYSNDNLFVAYDKLYRDIALFGKTCFPTAITANIPKIHHEIYSDLRDSSLKRLLFASFRGSAKSTIASLVYPLWRVAFKRSDEDLFIIIISEAQAQSINFLNRIKYHLERSKPFKMLFGDMGPNTAVRWTQNDIILRNGARILALGTGQRIRGAIEGDTRPNLIILDDCESELNAGTPEARASNRAWITDAVIPSLADNGRIIMIGTVIHEDCFLCWARNSDAWHVRWYGVVDDKNEPVWPERFPSSRIAEIKNEFASVGNLNGFYQEYMNIAQAPEDAPFKPQYMQMHSYSFKHVDGQAVLYKTVGEEEKQIPVNVYMGIDPASSLSSRADYFVIAVLGIDKQNNIYIIDIFRDRIDPALHASKIIEMYKRYKPRITRIETVAYQESLRSNVRYAARQEGIYIPGLENGYKSRTNKSERLFSLVPILAQMRFFFRNSDITAQQEFLSYPKGAHDDILDAIWFALVDSTPTNKESIIQKTDKKKRRMINWKIL